MLREIRLYQNGPFNFDTDQCLVTVGQQYETDENGNPESPFVLEDFTIKLNGEKIFSVEGQNRK